jgi:hypothetical protein
MFVFLSWVRLPSGNERRWTTVGTTSGWMLKCFWSRNLTDCHKNGDGNQANLPFANDLPVKKKNVHIFWRIIHQSEKKNNWNRAICGRFTGVTWPNHRFLCFHVRVTEENFVLHGWCLELLTRWSQAWTIDTIGVETRTSFLGTDNGLYSECLITKVYQSYNNGL